MTNQATPHRIECCGNCAHSRPGDGKMGSWVNCSFMKPYEYHSPIAGCWHKPSRWERRTQNGDDRTHIGDDAK